MSTVKLDVSKLFVLSDLHDMSTRADVFGRSISPTSTRRLATDKLICNSGPVLKNMGFLDCYANKTFYVLNLEQIKGGFRDYLLSHDIGVLESAPYAERSIVFVYLEDGKVYLEDTNLFLNNDKKGELIALLEKAIKQRKQRKANEAVQKQEVREEVSEEIAPEIHTDDNKMEPEQIVEELHGKAIRFEDTSNKQAEVNSDIKTEESAEIDNAQELLAEDTQEVVIFTDAVSDKQDSLTEDVQKLESAIKGIEVNAEEQSVVEDKETNVREQAHTTEFNSTDTHIEVAGQQGKPCITPICYDLPDGRRVYYLDDIVYWTLGVGHRFAKLCCSTGHPEKTTDNLRDDGYYSEGGKNKVFLVNMDLVDKTTGKKSTIVDFIKSQCSFIKSTEAPRGEKDALLYIVYKDRYSDDYYVDMSEYFIIERDTGMFYGFLNKMRRFCNRSDNWYDSTSIEYDSACNKLISSDDYKADLKNMIEDAVNSKKSDVYKNAKPVENLKDSGVAFAQYGDCLKLKQTTCSDKNFMTIGKKFTDKGYHMLNIDNRRVCFIPDMYVTEHRDIYNLLCEYNIISKERVTQADKPLYLMTIDKSGNYAVSESHDYLVYGYERILMKVMENIKKNAEKWMVKFIEW